MVAAEPTIRSESPLWDEEVAKLLAAQNLQPAARTAVRSVLAALAADESVDDAAKADVRKLLAGSGPDAPARKRAHRSPLRHLIHATVFGQPA